MKIINCICLVITLIVVLGCKINNSDQSKKISKIDSEFQNSNILRQVIYKGINAEVSIEKIIYEFPDQNNYYIKFVIKNISKKKIGIDLTNSTKQFYPNYWCFYCPVNEGINEGGRIIQLDNNYDQLRNNFTNGKITFIDVSKEVHYYRNICKYDDEIINFDNIYAKENFFRIRLDGQLIITNGKEIEELRLDNKSVEKRLVIFNFPILKKQIPKDEKQFMHKVIELRPQGL